MKIHNLKKLLVLMIISCLFSPNLFASLYCTVKLNGKKLEGIGRYNREKCQKMCTSMIDEVLSEKHNPEDLISCEIKEYIFFRKCSFALNNKFTRIFRTSICGTSIASIKLSDYQAMQKK